MKKGVILLITLGFVIALGAVIASVFSLSDRAFNRAYRVQSMDQSIVLFSDIKKLIDSYAEDLNSSEDLSTFLVGSIPFYDPKSGLSLDISLQPLSNKIDINSMLLKGKVDKNIQKFIRNICERYNVLDPDFFISLILDTIDKDTISRVPLSEIALRDLRYTNGAIYDKKQFMVLQRYYAKVAQDRNIFDVPWNKFIYFGSSKKAEIVDCDRMSKDMVQTLGLDSESFSGCSDLNTPEYKKIASKYRLKAFSKEDNYNILVKIYYEIDSTKDRASFTYDIKTKKASNFEFF